MDIRFDNEELKKIDEIKSRYPESKSAVMPVLWMAQEKFGWISDEVEKYVADLLELPVAQVHGVVSFYTMYYKKPMGKYHIQVCTNVSCSILEGDKIYEHLSHRLGIGNNECTPDMKFSLEEVECMGACGYAPMIAINQDYYENLDIEKVDNLIDALSSQ
jgi:NADH-quinone oxidoreductase E subunit